MLCSGITAPAAKLIRPATTPDGSLRRSAPVSPPPADTSSPDAIQARDIFTHINSSGERAGFVSAQLVAASDSYGLASVFMDASWALKLNSGVWCVREGWNPAEVRSD